MWIIGIIIIIGIIYFLISTNNESGYIEVIPFDKKFAFFIDGINKKLFNSTGGLIKKSNREYILQNNHLQLQFIYRKNTLFIVKQRDSFSVNVKTKYTFTGINQINNLNSIEKQEAMLQNYLNHYFKNMM